MASGTDMQFGAAKETTYGTRVAPTRFFEVMDAGFDFSREHYLSRGLSSNRWRRRRVQTTRAGGGDFNMEVPSVGFGFWLDLLHGNTPTVAQQGGTTAWLQTHSLSATPNKSATIQIGVPPVLTSTLLPFDYTGVMLSGAEFAWEPDGVLTFTPSLIIRDELTNQTLATFTPPSTSGLFSFKGGSLSIAGSVVADVIGGGSVSFEWPLRDDAYALGSSGLMNKPVPTELPTATLTTTADFNDLTHYNRVVNDTIADAVLLFEGATISGAHKETVQITIPDTGSQGNSPNVDGPGPVAQPIELVNASATGDPPEILYKSVDVAI